MKKLMIILTAFLGACVHAQTSEALPPLKTVPYVDVQKYLGKWYEIARYDQRFERGCVAATATYSLRSDGNLNVLNACHLNSIDGKVKSSTGLAVIVDKKTNAKLKVTFFWPFYGKYWIIDLGKNYEYAVVGHPDRTYLWILSRTPQMDDGVYQGILERLQEQHYDTSKLIKPPQIIDEKQSEH